MHFGLFSINAYAAIEPRTAARVARAAEAAGFESLWAGEHVVLPDPQAPPSPMGPTEPILDPAIALTFAAANTTRVRPGCTAAAMAALSVASTSVTSMPNRGHTAWKRIDVCV